MNLRRPAMKMVQLTEVVRYQGSGQGAAALTAPAPTFKKPLITTVHQRSFSYVGIMASPMPLLLGYHSIKMLN